MNVINHITSNPLQKRVLAVNDFSCFGKCSLNVAIAILTSFNIETVGLPTALLSTHTGGFEGYSFRPLTDEMRDIIAHLESEGLKADVIYSGYMCGKEQIDLMDRIIDSFARKDTKILIDPVMGDGGALYSNFDMDYVERMKKLCARADIITPNVTEAALLTDMTVDEIETDRKGIEICLDRLLLLGCRKIVITGVRGDRVKDKSGDMSFDSPTVGYVGIDGDRGEKIGEYYPYVDACLHGCGDVFASRLCAEIAGGKSDFKNAVHEAAEFTERGILRAIQLHPAHWYGLPFEEELDISRKNQF